MRARFIDVDGCRTRCLYEGAGAPVLLLHGFGGCADGWMRNIDPLGEHFSVYAPDQLGQGFTAPGDLGGGPPHPHIVEHLTKLLSALSIDRFAVVGQSFGALIALLLYFRMPERVTHLVVVGSGSAFNTEEELARTYAAVRATMMAAFEAPTLEACRRSLAGVVHDPASVAPEMLLSRLTAYALPWARDAYAAALDGMMDFERARRYRVLDRLEQVAVPTLVVWGRQDPRGVYARAVEAVKRLPRGQLVTFEACGHFPHLEHPDAFNRAVRDFLLRRPGCAPADC